MTAVRRAEPATLDAPAVLGDRPARSGRTAVVWCGVAAVVLSQIAYPLVHGQQRTALTIVTVLLFAATSLAHATLSAGPRTGLMLLLVAGVGGLLAEAVGTATGIPFGEYDYAASLGTQLLDVPIVVPLAWIMMAWPAWLVAGRLVGHTRHGHRLRVPLAAWALASWDLFLDPQMVAAGHWVWRHPEPALPLVADVPLTNYAGWILVATVMTGLLALTLPRHPPDAATAPTHADLPMHAVYLWTWASSLLAHLVFFGLPGSALAGGLAMGTVAVPLAVRLAAPLMPPPLMPPPPRNTMPPAVRLQRPEENRR